MWIEINVPMFWYNPKHTINIPYYSQTIKLYIPEPSLNNPDIINNAMKIIKKAKAKRIKRYSPKISIQKPNYHRKLDCSQRGPRNN
jgi:hypothetical protein